MDYWKTQTFKTQEAMEKFIEEHKGKIEYTEIFINNGYGIDYRYLKIIDWLE